MYVGEANIAREYVWRETWKKNYARGWSSVCVIHMAATVLRFKCGAGRRTARAAILTFIYGKWMNRPVVVAEAIDQWGARVQASVSLNGETWPRRLLDFLSPRALRYRRVKKHSTDWWVLMLRHWGWGVAWVRGGSEGGDIHGGVCDFYMFTVM